MRVSIRMHCKNFYSWFMKKVSFASITRIIIILIIVMYTLRLSLILLNKETYGTNRFILYKSYISFKNYCMDHYILEYLATKMSIAYWAILIIYKLLKKALHIVAKNILTKWNLLFCLKWYLVKQCPFLIS